MTFSDRLAMIEDNTKSLVLKWRLGTQFLTLIVTLSSLQLSCMGITSTLEVTRPPTAMASIRKDTLNNDTVRANLSERLGKAY